MAYEELLTDLLKAEREEDVTDEVQHGYPLQHRLF